MSNAVPPPAPSAIAEGRPAAPTAPGSTSQASVSSKPTPLLSSPSFPSSSSRSPPTTAQSSILALNLTLPSQSTQLHIAEARSALVASMSNMLDSELQSRASLLHANATALSKQERDVAKVTEALRKENDKLAKLAKDAGRKIKETGNVQNWAEVLERDFLVLEETMRLVREGSSSGSGSWSGSCSPGGSEAGSREGSRQGSIVSGVDEFLAQGRQERDGGVKRWKGKDIDHFAIKDVDGDVSMGLGSGTIAGIAGAQRSSESVFAQVDDAIAGTYQRGHDD